MVDWKIEGGNATRTGWLYKHPQPEVGRIMREIFPNSNTGTASKRSLDRDRLKNVTQIYIGRKGELIQAGHALGRSFKAASS